MTKQNIAPPNPESSRIANLERTLNRLYTCRDLEISNLWQRSIFLGAFLILCFTGYGLVFSSLPQSDDSIILQVGASALTIIGWVLSLIWIMMAKGSKAWVEVYETYIIAFEKKYCSEEELDIPEDFIMSRNITSRHTIDTDIFSINAGAFSVSKINIILGQFCIVIWSVLLTIHNTILANILLQTFCCNESCRIVIFASIVSILFTYAFISILTPILKKRVNSKVLTDAMNQQKK